ncbi:MAG: NAD(P)-dependent oxidoreductase [Ignavibacteria bacterium]
MYKILVADDVDPSGIEKLSSKKFTIVNKPGISDQKIFSEYSDFDILVIRSVRKIDKAFLNKVSFKLIATCSKGTDHIDLKYASIKKVKVINAEEGNTISAAEHTLALILNIYKGVLISDDLVRKNKFTDTGFRRNELTGKTIGIIGFGKVGSYAGKLCKAFGMKVAVYDIDNNLKIKYKKFNFTDLKTILKYSDIVTIHIPMSKKNHNFISESKLNLLKTDCVLINTSRGGVIDEDHLLWMMKNKKIRFAGLDVFRNEPSINKGFTGLDNVLLTNHIAGKTVESRQRISEFIFSKINKYKV